MAFLLPLNPLFGAEFHVAPGGDDSNPGSAAEPWETLAKANATLNPGDMVWIHAGTYSDAIRPARSGTSDTNRIVYRAFGDGDVVLVGFPGNGGPEEGALALGERSYVTVNGRAPGDPPTSRRIRLVPQGFVNSLGNVCGSEGVVVENIHGDCGAAGGVCGRGFGFCINYWEGDYESRFNVLRGSYLRGVSSTSQDPLDYTEDIVTIAHRAHHNLIEDNILTTCRHTSLYADWPTSHSNVVRNNHIENPQHTALSIWSAGVSLPEGARFLVEGNVLSASGGTSDPDGFPGNALQWGSDELIIRFNEITDGGSANQQSTSIGGLAGATSTSFGSPYFATDGRVYNNTVARNRGVAVGMMDFGIESVDLGRHRFVNNIFYDSLADPTDRLLAVYWDADFDTADRYINNLWGNPGSATDQLIFSSSKRGSANLADAIALWRNPEDPEFTAWHGWVNQFDATPGFRDYGAGDLRLAAGNPYSDAGAPLTRVDPGDLGSGLSLAVEDARFFFAEAAEFPAWMGVQGEQVAIGSDLGTAERAQVTAVDDATGVLTLDRDLNREAGDFVWLIRDSSGRSRLSGQAPALGAHDTDEVFSDGFESGDTSGWSLTAPVPTLVALPIPLPAGR